MLAYITCAGYFVLCEKETHTAVVGITQCDVIQISPFIGYSEMIFSFFSQKCLRLLLLTYKFFSSSESKMILN